jgi:hypothetical protein
MVINKYLRERERERERNNLNTVKSGKPALGVLCIKIQNVYLGIFARRVRRYQRGNQNP